MSSTGTITRMSNAFVARGRDDLDGRGSAEEASDLVDRADGRRQADALRRCAAGVQRLAQRVEALEADREVRAALGRRDGVHLVDDHGVHARERLRPPGS